MRATWKAQRPKIGTAVGDFIPAPTGGWDAISALSNMPPDRAVKMDNWIPRPGYIEVRNGFNSFATGLGTLTTPVESVMSYNNYGTGSALFAAAGSVIYDITAGGVGVSKVTGLSNSRFQHKMFSNSSGTQYLVCVNGVDGVRTYNGSSWATQTITGTGVSSGSFVDVTAHKGRLWFVQDQSTAPVYMAIGAISGTGTTFELGNFMTKGGFVQAVGTWTVDTRQSVDEYIAFITSRGEVIVYQGTDPSSSTTWDLVGVYSIGPPIGRRCKLRIAGDLLIISLDGVNGMSSTLSTDRAAANRVSITANILNTIHGIDIQASIDGQRPDAYFTGPLAFGQLIESLTPQDAYIQPEMARAAGGNDLVFNGNPVFIDNYMPTGVPTPATFSISGSNSFGQFLGLNSSYIKLVINPKAKFATTDWIAAQNNATVFCRIFARLNLVVLKPSAHFNIYIQGA